MNQEKAIVILGGALVKDKTSGLWRTTRYDEAGDNFGVQGDRLRVDATAYAYHDDHCMVITSGGTGQLTGVPGIEPLASVLERELIELSVDKKYIIKEDQSGNTYRQLLAIKGIIEKNNFKHILIISNSWHLPRIKAFVNHAPRLGQELLSLARIDFASAEEICLKHDKNKWHDVIDNALKSSEMLERIKLEEKGRKQIKDGTYDYK